jgi:hypothetical protein
MIRSPAISCPSRRVLPAWVLAWLPLAVAGCGQAEYDQRLSAKVSLLQQGTAFIEKLHDQATGVAPNVSLRLPRLFNENSQALNERSQDESRKPMPTARIQPPFAPLPGFRLCYERFYPSGETNLPVYCYLAAVEAEGQDPQALRGQLQQALRAQFRTAAWQEVSLKTPSGEPLACHKISASGKQSFFNQRGLAEEGVDARYELYMHSTPQYHVLVGWRAPQSLISETDLFAVGELSVGTLPPGS